MSVIARLSTHTVIQRVTGCELTSDLGKLVVEVHDKVQPVINQRSVLPFLHLNLDFDPILCTHSAYRLIFVLSVGSFIDR